MEEEFDLSDIMSEEVEGGELAGAGKADRLKEVEEQLKVGGGRGRGEGGFSSFLTQNNPCHPESIGREAVGRGMPEPKDMVPTGG